MEHFYLIGLFIIGIFSLKKSSFDLHTVHHRNIETCKIQALYPAVAIKASLNTKYTTCCGIIIFNLSDINNEKSPALMFKVTPLQAIKSCACTHLQKLNKQVIQI